MKNQKLEISIRNFQEFCKREFFLDQKIARLKDAREAPKISAGTVFLVIFFSVGILRYRSLLGADQFVRKHFGRCLFRSKKPVVSESTISRSLEGYDLEKLRSLLGSIYLSGRKSGQYKYSLNNRKKIKVGIVEGTSFNKLMASAFQQIGEVNVMLDWELIPKRGKELPVSEALIKRLSKTYGRRLVDLVLGDSLYMASNFINACTEECGIEVLVKTDEVSLNIVKEAIALFEIAQISPKDFPMVEIREDVDLTRMCTYTVLCASGFHHEGIPKELKIAYVKEKHIKTQKESSFFTITTLTSLQAADMRELAHERWSIENNGFKELNEQCNTKHLYSHRQQAQQAAILILFIAFNLYNLFTSAIDYELDIRPTYARS